MYYVNHVNCPAICESTNTCMVFEYLNIHKVEHDKLSCYVSSNISVKIVFTSLNVLVIFFIINISSGFSIILL